MVQKYFYMLEINKIYNCDCLEGLKKLPDNSVDLTVTSPPYDNLRTYHEGDEFVWNFDIFKPIADELYRVTKPGCCVVWVVGDAVINGGETGSSFRQALYFQELGFKIHDTMIYEKNSSTFPAKETSKRYSQLFEYMFVFVKGKKIRDDIRLIADKKNKWAGWTNWGTHTNYDKNGNLVPTTNNKPTPEYSLRNNIWRYTVSFNDKTGHPAVFPERLAQDHILSWSKEGDLVLDPFMGSGTTAKMAKLNKRNYIGFEKNTKYYEESLVRVAKYDDVLNDNVITVSDSNDGEVLQLSIDESDKEFEGKKELWGKLVKGLEGYFNEQKLEILKNLTFTFKSKSNDDKVKQILIERGLFTGATEENIVVETPVDTKETCIAESNKTNTELDSLLAEQLKEIKERCDTIESKCNEQQKEIERLQKENQGLKDELSAANKKQDIIIFNLSALVDKLKSDNDVVSNGASEKEEYIAPESNETEETPVELKKRRNYTYSADTKVVIITKENNGMVGKIIGFEGEPYDVTYKIELDDENHSVIERKKGEFKGVRGKRNSDVVE